MHHSVAMPGVVEDSNSLVGEDRPHGAAAGAPAMLGVVSK